MSMMDGDKSKVRIYTFFLSVSNIVGPVDGSREFQNLRKEMCENFVQKCVYSNKKYVRILFKNVFNITRFLCSFFPPHTFSSGEIPRCRLKFLFLLYHGIHEKKKYRNL